MPILPGQLTLRLIILLLLNTLLLSCGSTENPVQEGNGAGISFRLKWPVAKSVGSVPSGVDTIRMSVSGPGMSTIIRDFPASAGTGSIPNVPVGNDPVGNDRTITFQGFSGPAIIFQKDITPVKLVKGVTYNCGTVNMEIVANNLSTSTAPTAPSGLSAEAVSTSQINLVWVDNANNETGYIIERKTGADTAYTNIATVAANDTIYTDTTPSADTTYQYRVQAINDVTNSQVIEAAATTTVVVPAKTYSISGAITSGGAALAGATVTRSGNGSTTKSIPTDGNYRFDGTQNGSFTLTPAKNGYTFDPPSRVVTVDGADQSAMNFVVTAVNTIPAAPSGLSATSASSNLISLAWADNANNETGYKIERAISGGTYATIATVAANVTIYNDTAVSVATTYNYRVRAANGVGDSGYSNDAGATTPVPTYNISGMITSEGYALAGVTVTLNGSGSTATTANSTGNYSFSGAQNGSYTLTPTMAGYTFDPAILTVTVNGANLSAMNFMATANTLPAVPSGLSATAVSSNLVNLAWVDNANNETGYKIERKAGSGGTYAQIGTVAANATIYKDTGLSASTVYYYRVLATNGIGDSGYAAEANVTTLVAPTYPDLLKVTGGTYTMGDSTLSDASPHLVSVGDFYIGSHEVTQGEWLAVMGTNPSSFKACGADCPVDQVSWDDVQNFISTLNQQSGKSYRLPTEAEWEYAARSGGKAETYSGGSNVDAVAWYSGNSGGTTHPVGLKQGNGLGINDMSGNVWEWVSDLYGSTYYSSSPQTNPSGPTSGSTRVIRGGSWKAAAAGKDGERTSTRGFAAPTFKTNYFGFRLAASVQ